MFPIAFKYPSNGVHILVPECFWGRRVSLTAFFLEAFQNESYADGMTQRPLFLCPTGPPQDGSLNTQDV